MVPSYRAKIALYFSLKVKSIESVCSCDKWDKIGLVYPSFFNSVSNKYKILQ